MENLYFGKLAFALSLATAATMTVMIPASNADSVKKPTAQKLKVENGQLRQTGNGEGIEIAQTKAHRSDSRPAPRQQRRIREHKLGSEKHGHGRSTAVRKRAHNLVSGKVKKTNKRTGLK